MARVKIVKCHQCSTQFDVTGDAQYSVDLDIVAQQAHLTACRVCGGTNISVGEETMKI